MVGNSLGVKFQEDIILFDGLDYYFIVILEVVVFVEDVVQLFVEYSFQVLYWYIYGDVDDGNLILVQFFVFFYRVNGFCYFVVVKQQY